MPDTPIIKGGATPNDSNPRVIGGTYPEEVDWIAQGIRDGAGKGVNANRLRTLMEGLGNNFTEETEEIPGDIFKSGPQLDNGGDIELCTFIAAACVFIMIKRHLPKVGIKVTAGNNQFFQNFQDAQGRLLDSNHRKGKAINFEIKGIDPNTSYGEMNSKQQQKINDVEEILQSITAGNKWFQYINEYKKGTRDGDKRNNFLISMGGPCCPPPDDSGAVVEYNENLEVINQHCDWWEGYVNRQGKKLKKPKPTGEYGYIEGVSEKLTAIGLASRIRPHIEIVDLYQVVQSSDEINDECPGNFDKLKVVLPKIKKPSIKWPKSPEVNITSNFKGSIKIKFTTNKSLTTSLGNQYFDTYMRKSYATGRTKSEYFKGKNNKKGGQGGRNESNLNRGDGVFGKISVRGSI